MEGSTFFILEAITFDIILVPSTLAREIGLKFSVRERAIFSSFFY